MATVVKLLANCENSPYTFRLRKSRWVCLAVKEPGSLTTEQDGIKKYNVGTKQNPNICSDSLHSISIPYKKGIIDRRPTMQTK